MNDEEMTEGELMAAVFFGTAFAEYVKEVDPELWKRAREFAFDWCEKIEGIRLIKTEDQNKPKDNL